MFYVFRATAYVNRPNSDGVKLNNVPNYRDRTKIIQLNYRLADFSFHESVMTAHHIVPQ